VLSDLYKFENLRTKNVLLAICGLPITIGTCLGYFERFAYNEAKNQCVSFIYGGCHGNQNNFRNRNDCEEKCK
ncbi:hypothetical protein KR067_005501, partial [Drosophila pandora]